MSNTLYVLFTPLLLFLSLPLLAFALLTTSLAFSTLFIRVLIVYIELFISILNNYLTFHTTTSSSKPSSKPSSPRSRSSKSRRSSGSVRTNSDSTTGSGSATPLAFPSSTAWPSSASLVVAGTRDFEGVGGWRFPGPDSSDDERRWVAMNSRLELPNLSLSTPVLGFERSQSNGRKRHHTRSRTSGSLNSPEGRILTRKEARRDGAFDGSKTPTGDGEGGNLAGCRASKSMTELQQTGTGPSMGKIRLSAPRKLSGSSTVSGGS